MFTNAIQLYSILAFCVVYVQSISITSIVRFNCKHGKITQKHGCIGTFILPNIVLTTSFCAENCQSIGKVQIVRSYIHTFYKNYVHGIDYVARNDIGLVLMPPEARKSKLVKLSALDTISTIGQKALIPIMDHVKPRLQVTLLEGCYKTQSFGYYVCTTNKMSKRAINVCQERQDQGVPLLLQDRIFGIMGMIDRDTCHLPQRSFTAIGPALDWISATVKKLGYKDSVITTLHDKYIYSDSTGPVHRSFTNATTSSSSATITTAATATASNIPTPNKYLNSAHKLENWFFSNTPFTSTDIITLSEPSGPSTVLKSLLRNDENLLPRITEYTDVATTTTEDPNAAITFIPSPTSKRSTQSVTSTTTPKKESTTHHTIPFVILNADNKTTNVMDWFNEMVKDRLKNNPSMYYVVSSTTTTRRPINFIDLT